MKLYTLAWNGYTEGGEGITQHVLTVDSKHQVLEPNRPESIRMPSVR